MALPLIPIALAAGTVAVARNIQVLPVDQRREDRLDAVEEGLAMSRDPQAQAVNGAYRYRRVVRWGDGGPGFEVDFTGLARLKVTKL